MAIPDRVAEQPTTDDVPPGPGGRWRTALRLAVAGVFLGVIVVVLGGQWRQARALLARASGSGGALADGVAAGRGRVVPGRDRGRPGRTVASGAAAARATVGAGRAGRLGAGAGRDLRQLPVLAGRPGRPGRQPAPGRGHAGVLPGPAGQVRARHDLAGRAPDAAGPRLPGCAR